MKKIAIVLLILVGLLSCSLLACTHIHSYEGWEYDDTNHWRECECGAKFEFGEHSFNENGVCECGYNDKKGADGHTHIYGEWKFDDFEHWKECVTCDRVVQRGAHIFDDTATCTYCRTKATTSELKYELNADGNSYTVVGIETKEVSYIKVPMLYEGKPVTAVGDNAFEGAQCISVIISDGVKAIGEGAFKDCKNLAEVVMDVTTIGKEAFYGCEKLTEMTIDNVTEMGEGVFYGCERLSKVSMNGVAAISKNAFYGCYGLTSVSSRSDENTVSMDSVTTIGENAFYNCANITSVNLPNSVKAIGARAFANCGNMRTISIPSAITSIGKSVFSGCDSLIYTEEPDKTKGHGLYLGNASNRYLIFMGLDRDAYNPNCSINDDTKIIYHEAFAGCKGLYSVMIGRGVTLIGERIFDGCTALSIIEVSSFNTHGISGQGNCLINNASRTLIAGCKDSAIPDGITKIGKAAFAGCSGLTELDLPSSVTSIEESAFEGCSGLTSITIPSSVKSIGAGAFGRCDELSELTVKSGVESIGERAFIECKSLTAITIPSSVTSVGNRAFEFCSGLKTAKIEGATELGDDVFYGCLELESVVALNAKSIGKSAFSGCEKLNSVAFGSRIAQIPDEAFANCDKLSTVFFKGTAEGWNKVVIGENNSALNSATVYYYSEQEPTDEQWIESEYWWHLLDGEPTIWAQQ